MSNYWIERMVCEYVGFMLFIFSRNALCKQCWNKARGAVSGKTFYYLPNFGQISGRREGCAKLSPGGRFCLEYYPSSLLSTPFENDNVTQKPSPFHSVKSMLYVFDGNVTLLISPWNCDFNRPLGLRNSFQSSFPHTRFKEAVSIVQ